MVSVAPRLHWNWLHPDKFAPLLSVKGVRQFDKSADRLSLTQTTKLSKTIFVCHVHLYLQTVMVYILKKPWRTWGMGTWISEKVEDARCQAEKRRREVVYQE